MIVDKRSYNGLSFWTAYHECGFLYELHVNQLQGKIGIIHYPAHIRHGKMEVIDIGGDLSHLRGYFGDDAYKEICEYLNVEL